MLLSRNIIKNIYSSLDNRLWCTDTFCLHKISGIMQCGYLISLHFCKNYFSRFYHFNILNGKTLQVPFTSGARQTTICEPIKYFSKLHTNFTLCFVWKCFLIVHGSGNQQCDKIFIFCVYCKKLKSINTLLFTKHPSVIPVG